MIQEFSVRNFFSIKDEQKISFEATKDDTAKELLTVRINKNVVLLKIAILYGANASGKSNILLAIQKIWELLFRPNFDKNQVIDVVPFALTQNEDTTMSIIFYKEEIKYKYNIVFNQHHIVSETMTYAPNGILSLFYERKYEGDNAVPYVKFGDLKLSAKAQNSIKENTFNNHTVLSTFGKISVNADKLADLHTWIAKRIHEVNYQDPIVGIAQSVIADKNKMQFFLDAIAKADFNITNFQIVEKDRILPKSLITSIKENTKLSDEDKVELLNRKEKDIEFYHTTEKGHFTLSGRFESEGTLEYFALLDILYNVFNENHIYLLDELEKNLHYDLLIQFLMTYMMNSNSSQLIFTTHDQVLLDEDFIRRDMIWFTEKSNKTGGTELFSALDFGLHKNISLYKAYKTGKLGAKPEIGSPFIDIK